MARGTASIWSDITAALVTEGSVTQETIAEAIVKYAIDVADEAPWSR